MSAVDPKPTGNPPRLQDLRADELRKWRGMGATREEFDSFWLMIDELLKDLRGRAA